MGAATVEPTDAPGGRVVEQRIRNRVIEVLELAASYEDQVEYEKAVRFVNVPYELINQYEDWVRADPRTDPAISAVYSDAEVQALGQFHDSWDAAADAIPDDYPAVGAVQPLPQWMEMRRVAQAALTVFEVRGKLSEDHEVE